MQAPGAIAPIFEYDHSGGRCVVTGGYVIRDPRLASLNGRYVYADSLGLPIVDGLASFGEGRNGKIYVVSLGGPVYRLDP